MENLEKTLNLYFGEKAPALPTQWKEAIVKFSPWISLILLVLTLPALLLLFGLGAFLVPFSYAAGYNEGFTYTVSLLILAVTVVLEAAAIPALFKRSRRGWLLIYYSVLITAVYNLVTMNLGGLILGTLLSLYILFQVRSYYK